MRPIRSSVVVACLLVPALAAAQDERLDFLYTASLDEAGFGRSVALLDDVNGDGFPEIAVASSQGNGVVHLLSGVNGTLLRSFHSPQMGIASLFGRSLSLVPDVNNDGIADLAVGAHDHVPTGNEDASGLVYIVNPTDMSILQTLSSPAPVQDGAFGFSLDGYGDTQANGLRGVIVGAPNEHGAPTEDFSNAFAGRAYVFNGRTGELVHTFVNPTETAEQDATQGNFGQAVAAVSGFRFFHVSEPGANFSTDTFTNTGRIYRYEELNQVAFTRNPAAIVTDARFGEYIGVVPNIDRENSIRPGLAVGIPNPLPEDPSMSFGRGEVYDHVSSNSTNRNFQAPVQQTNSDFGVAVEGILDATGDGRGDAVFGHPRLGAGFAYVYNPFLPGLALTLPRPGEPQERSSFGVAISGTREHHKAQSRRRLVVGAPAGAVPQGPAGKIYVYKLRARLRGDMNNDKQVNNNDVLTLDNFLKGFINTSDGTILDVLDYDNDGDIDAADLAALNAFVNGPPDTTTTTTTTTSSTSSTSSTSTTLAPEEICGDADGNGVVNAADALRVLKAAVSSGACPLVRCDTNGDGSVTAADALRVLRAAVGLGTLDNCPQAT